MFEKVSKITKKENKTFFQINKNSKSISFCIQLKRVRYQNPGTKWRLLRYQSRTNLTFTIHCVPKPAGDLILDRKLIN